VGSSFTSFCCLLALPLVDWQVMMMMMMMMMMMITLDDLDHNDNYYAIYLGEYLLKQFIK